MKSKKIQNLIKLKIIFILQMFVLEDTLISYLFYMYILSETYRNFSINTYFMMLCKLKSGKGILYSPLTKWCKFF